MNKSLGKNAFLNGFKNALNLLFPLLTFPYVSKILSVDGIGQYNFAQATVSYFSMLAGLGVSSYAIREGAKYRDDRNKFNVFASEVLLCNTISTIIAYLLLAFCMLFVDKLKSYVPLIWIFSIQIVFTTIGIEWLYSIYEEYEYITVRIIAFKIISIVLIFLCVKDSEDAVNYATITVFSSVGSNLLNLIHSKEYFHIVKVKLRDCAKHIKPILVIFASNIAIMIYVYSDTTILGFMTTDHEVGVYSVSVKVYNIIKNLLSSALVVSIPRLSMYYGSGRITDFKNTAQKVYDSVTALVLPAVVGLFCVSKNVILAISDDTYISAETSLKILCVALLFCIYGWFFSQCVLMPIKKESVILVATCISATVNIALNFCLIPIWEENAAAFTTLVAEFIMFLICAIYGQKTAKIRLLSKNMCSVIIGCTAIICLCKLILNSSMSMMLQLVAAVIASAIAYGIVLFLFRNEVIYALLRKVYRCHEK